MQADAERTYLDSTWAARRWDQFNDDRIVEPLSFCQFWRTVLLWATIKQLLTPARVAGRIMPDFTIEVPGIPQQVPAAGRLLLRGIVRGLWLLLYPLRLLLPPTGRAALSGVVAVGEPLERFGQRHKDGLKYTGRALIIIVGGGEIIFFLTLAFLASWFWTAIGIGSAVGGSFAIYGFVKSGAPRLAWDAAVAAKHGICPPVSIVREL